MSPPRPVAEIARDIIKTWVGNRSKANRKGEMADDNYAIRRWPDVVYFGAVPYLEAMLRLLDQDQTPMYGADTLDSVILYGLSNMAQFRGERAKELKAELRTHLSRSYGK